MAYATVAQFKSRIDDRIVLDLTGDGGTAVDDGAIRNALDDASAVIDGYLERIPSADRPSAAVLLPYCVDIAVYRLQRNRPGQDFESIGNAFEAAVRFLSGVARGRYPITPKTDGESGAVFTTAGRIFSRKSLEEF